MGQKVNPISFRTGINKPWSARWFFAAKGGGTRAAKYPYAAFLAEDEEIRNIVRRKINQAGIAGIEIDRTSASIRVTIRAARPGLIIGQGGRGIEELSRAIETAVRKLRGPAGSKQRMSLSLNVEELKRSDVAAAHIAQLIAWDLERRLRFRRLMKRYLDQVVQNKGVKGAKILLSGRLDGGEIARREFLRQGALPLQTLRADIDYGTATAFTTYGTVGVKVWIYRGDVFKKEASEQSNRGPRNW
jgi:small subunit ribosomal protein S3